jgi:hypothetical protein
MQPVLKPQLQPLVKRRSGCYRLFMTKLLPILLTLSVLAAFALMAGGVVLLRRGTGSRLKAGLMIAAGLIALMNVYSFSTLSN